MAALLVFAMAMIAGVACIAPKPFSPAPAPRQANKFPIYNQFEADALNAVFRNWTEQNPQLSSILKWSPDIHPCTGVNLTSSNEGAWRGVYCSHVISGPLVSNATGEYYQVSVSSLQLFGSHTGSCTSADNQECGFNGINGVLPSEIGKLTNLTSLGIQSNPGLTGPVPLEIWQLPKLVNLWLSNNSLTGPIPGPNDFIPNSTLTHLYLDRNNFSGRLELNSQGAFYSSSLLTLNVSGNQLDGPVDFQGLNFNASTQLLNVDLSNNCFSGTFSTGPLFNPATLTLSNNAFTAIKFANYTGQYPVRGLGTVYMPGLSHFLVANNKLSGPCPPETLQIPYLRTLNLSGNNLSGSVDFNGLLENSRIRNIISLDLSNNRFSGIFSTSPLFNPHILILSNNAFTAIKLANYTGQDLTRGPGTVYMPGLTYLFVANNKLSGPFPPEILQMPSLQYFNNSYNGTFSSDSHFDLQKLDLSNNYFKMNIQNNNLNGEFPSQIFKSPTLRILNGGQNQYTGTLQLPDISIEDSNLSMVSLINNQFNYVSYPNTPGRFSTSNLQVSNLLFLNGNPICNEIETQLLATICRLNQSSPALPVISRSHTKSKLIISISTSTTFTFIFFIIALYVWKLMGRIKSLNIILGELEKREVKPNLYSYKEIKLATKNFDKENILGEGGFGVVYKGELYDGTLVAVKKLTMSSSQVLSDFLNEVVVISGLKHRNLVKLKGCCLGDGDQRMLVFEFVENKNLAQALLIQENLESSYLDWTTRFNIIIGIARGLAYLHQDLQSPVIHRDIKASNILLDKDYNPKIADFGLAYLFPALESKASHLTMMEVAGTRGYLSPEYALHYHVSTALDVYSFGILVLEIVSGRKCIDHEKSEKVYLLDWAWKQYQAQALMVLIDPKMKHTSEELEIILRTMNVALACVQYKAAKRPKMHDVVSMLLGSMPLNDFQLGFEDRGTLDNTFAFSTTSSSQEVEKFKMDDCSLLNNVCDIEMKEMGHSFIEVGL